MTSPWPAPNPNPLPGGPCSAPLKPCCGEVLLGEECACAQDRAELAAAFRPRDLRCGDQGPITIRFPASAAAQIAVALRRPIGWRAA